MDDRPRNLRAALAAAKHVSELMVDLAYASVYFGDRDVAAEVAALELDLSEVVLHAQTICVLAARSPREANAMASVLQVISAIERIGNAAVDISRIVSRRIGIPVALIAGLYAAEEVSYRVEVQESARVVEMRTRTGMSVIAILRRRSWITAIAGDDVVEPGDVVFLRGPRHGIPGLRALLNAPEWEMPQMQSPVTEVERAVEVLVTMKNISEVAVRLAYSVLSLRDRGLAVEVSRLGGQLVQMRERVESWTLRAAVESPDPSTLRGLLQLSRAAEEIGDAAQQMTWSIERTSSRGMRPVPWQALLL